MQGVHTLGKSSGESEQDRAIEGGALLAGEKDAPAKNYADPTLSEGVSLLSAGPSSTPGVALPNLDLLAELDEPEQLVRAVMDLATSRLGPRWFAVQGSMSRLLERLEAVNSPAPR